MKIILQFVAAALLCFSCLGADLGDPAADLQIKKWIKGENADLGADPKNIYVVEFWATWCGPCRTSIPHLTDLQKKFKDKKVIFIGISDEKEPVVRDFVKKMGDQMDYRVAIDDERKTSEGYMEKYGVEGIPHAFVVQNKKILWHGHPMDELEETLEQVVAGKYDVAAAKTKMKASALLEEFVAAVAEGKNDRADEIAKELQTMTEALKAVLPDGEFKPEEIKKEIRAKTLKNQFFRASVMGNTVEAEKAAKELKIIAPDEDLEDLKKKAALFKLNMEYLDSVSEEGDKAKAEKLGPELLAKLKGQPELANEVAWTILTHEEVKHRDVPLALKISKQGCEDSNWEEADLIDTYARALFESGKKQEAIEIQARAVDKAPEHLKSQLEETLKGYKEANR